MTVARDAAKDVRMRLTVGPLPFLGLQIGAIGYAGDYPPLKYEGFVEFMDSLGQEDVSEVWQPEPLMTNPPYL